jgi:hypothetical protein
MPTARSVRRPMERRSSKSDPATTSTRDPSPPTLLSSVAEGFAFGIGSSIARNSVDRIFGMGSNNRSTKSEYEKCLKDNWGDASFCAHLKESTE